MSRRAKIVISVIVLLLVALVAALLWWLYSRQSTALPVVNTAVDTTTNTAPLPIVNSPPRNTNTPTVPVVETPAPQPSGQAAVRRLAMAFAERFGSYSSEGDFTNITDLRSLMTPSLQTWADRYVEEQRAKASTGAMFFGTTTRALNAEFQSFDDGAGTASVTVSAQRRETSSTDAEGRVYYQDLRMVLVKQGGAWLVDSVRWLEVAVQ
jgi:hypothetical protein